MVPWMVLEWMADEHKLAIVNAVAVVVAGHIIVPPNRHWRAALFNKQAGKQAARSRGSNKLSSIRFNSGHAVRTSTVREEPECGHKTDQCTYHWMCVRLSSYSQQTHKTQTLFWIIFKCNMNWKRSRWKYKLLSVSLCESVCAFTCHRR